MNRKEIAMCVGFVAMVALIVYTFAPAPGDLYGGPQVGNTAIPAKVELLANPGQEVDLADTKGKVVLLDFWATWCGPCRASMPELDAIYKKYRDRGLEVYGISQEAMPKVADFAKASPVTYPLAIDIEGRVNKAYGIQAIPNEVLIGKNGRILYQSSGFEGDELADHIEQALKG